MTRNQPIDLADLEKLNDDWAQHSNDGLIALGMAWRGHGGNLPANAVPENVWRAEYEAARRLGLPISVHSSGSKAARGQIAGLAKANMIGKDCRSSTRSMPPPRRSRR